MPMNSENTRALREPIEQATAAPGEQRAVKPPKRKRKRKSKRARSGK